MGGVPSFFKRNFSTKRLKILTLGENLFNFKEKTDSLQRPTLPLSIGKKCDLNNIKKKNNNFFLAIENISDTKNNFYLIPKYKLTTFLKTHEDQTITYKALTNDETSDIIKTKLYYEHDSFKPSTSSAYINKKDFQHARITSDGRIKILSEEQKQIREKKRDTNKKKNEQYICLPNQEALNVFEKKLETYFQIKRDPRNHSGNILWALLYGANGDNPTLNPTQLEEGIKALNGAELQELLGVYVGFPILAGLIGGITHFALAYQHHKKVNDGKDPSAEELGGMLKNAAHFSWKLATPMLGSTAGYAVGIAVLYGLSAAGLSAVTGGPWGILILATCVGIFKGIFDLAVQLHDDYEKTGKVNWKNAGKAFSKGLVTGFVIGGVPPFLREGLQAFAPMLTAYLLPIITVGLAGLTKTLLDKGIKIPKPNLSSSSTKKPTATPAHQQPCC